MKARPYKSYKSAAATWLNALPESWDQVRGRFVMAVNPSSQRARRLDETDEVSFVPMDAVGEYGGLSLERAKLLEEIGSGYTEFEDGDVVVAKITPCFENGKGAIAEGLRNGVAYGSTELHVLRSGSRLDHRFLFYLTISRVFRDLGESEMYGAGGQKRVPPEFPKNFRVPLPPIDDQESIARFLDVKTIEIDGLIVQKRKLIERLNEKRLALVGRTVTRGLPPEVAIAAGIPAHSPMKPSGVDWLAQIPAHWLMHPLKRIVSTPITDGPHETPEFPLAGVPFVSAEAVQDGRVVLSSMRGYISREDHERYSKKYCPKKDDIFVVKSGSTTGKVAIVDFDEEFNVWSPLAAVRCDPRKALPRFVFYALTSEYFQGLVQVSWSFGTQPNIGMGVIGSLPVVLPPVSEQILISNYLDREVARIDSNTERARLAIDRLAEYRQRVITSAVTGEIDVRELA